MGRRRRRKVRHAPWPSAPLGPKRARTLPPVRRDQSARSVAQRRRRLARREERRTHERAVDEHRELAGERIGPGGAKALGENPEPPPQLALVGDSDLARGMIGVGEFRRDIELRTAAIMFAPDPFADPSEVRVELGEGIVAVAAGDAIPDGPEILVLAREKGGNEIVLGPEVTVQARLGHARLLDNAIDTDRPHPAPVEEGARGFQESRPDLGAVGVRHRCLPAIIVLRSA